MRHALSRVEPQRHVLSRLVRLLEVVLALWSVPAAIPGFSVRAALAVVALSLASCVATPAQAPAAVGQTTTTAADVPVHTGMLESTTWLAEHIDDPGIVVLHVDRDRRSYNEGHIPGARFLSLDRIAPDGDVPVELAPVPKLEEAFEEVGVSDGSRIILYGGMGGLAAARAFLTLDVIGHGDHAALLDGGLETWKQEGRRTMTEPDVRAPGTLTPRPALDRIVDAKWVRERLGEPSVVLVDTRRPREFSGAEGRAEESRRGHIPGAKNLYWEDLFADLQTRRLKDRESLRAMFEQVGVRPDRTVVLYCTVGLRSSFGYFVSRYLGYETKMYDGSFSDWSRRADFPVER